MKRWPYIAFFLFVCVSIVGGVSWKIALTSSGNTHTEAYHQAIRNGLAEAGLPTSNNLNAINSGADSLGDFIYNRSGVQLSSANMNTLRSAEENAWNTSKRVDSTDLTQILTDIAIERIQSLNSSEIDAVTDSLRGFNAPGLPVPFQGGRDRVKLRASGLGQMPANEFSSELTNLKNGGIQGKVAQYLIYVSVSSEVNRRIDLIRNAEPNFFGGTKSEMTPMQALLVAYSVVADDPLTGNSVELAQKMQDYQQLSSSQFGSYPSQTGHKAYGDNGYLYSSPTSLMLNDYSIARLLSEIQERGN